MTEHKTPAAQSQPDTMIEVDYRLSTEDITALRQHVAQHGLTDLPFGAKVVRTIPE
ncbi:hypothetical protein [Streptomyces sp. NPDC008141]|uniref:hypothetical protein n=1 Tax=Streptomyces sp. NPDC008141 TaxID=3364815 RepID=UPI0036E1EDEF